MDLDPRNSLLNWTYFCQGKSVDEVKQILLCTNLELQAVRQQAQEEIRKRDDELRRFKDILSKAVKERDEAQDKLQQLLVQKFSFQNHPVVEQPELQKVHLTGPVSGVTSIEDEPKRGLDSNNGFSSSEGDESIISSPIIDTLPPPPLPPQPRLPMSTSFHEEMMELLLHEKQPLPEKGKLLDAVMNAGPLLQTLILAGPLPQWRHPPPPLESSQVPPVAIPPSPSIAGYGSLNTNCGVISRNSKLTIAEGSASSTKNKNQRIILN